MAAFAQPEFGEVTNVIPDVPVGKITAFESQSKENASKKAEKKTNTASGTPVLKTKMIKKGGQSTETNQQKTLTVSDNKPEISDEKSSDPQSALQNMLVIIDGRESTKEQLMAQKPHDIASIQIMKGETGVPKYGDKAKGGVIIVTTKAGGQVNE